MTQSPHPLIADWIERHKATSYPWTFHGWESGSPYNYYARCEFAGGNHVVALTYYYNPEPHVFFFYAGPNLYQRQYREYKPGEYLEKAEKSLEKLSCLKTSTT